MSGCCGGNGCGGGCGGCGGGGCGGCGGGGCGGCGGGGCGGCGGGGGCCGCRRRPVALISFNREGITKLIDAAKKGGKDSLHLERTGKGIEVIGLGDAAAVPAEEMEFNGPMSPIYGWKMSDAQRKPCTEYFPEGAKMDAKITVFEEELAQCYAPNPLLFGLMLINTPGCEGDFGLMKVPWRRLEDDAYKATRTPDAESEALPENLVPDVFVKGFNVDPIAFGCAEIHKGMEFLYTTLPPKVGMHVFLHVVVPEKYSVTGYARMVGDIVEVGALPKLYDPEIEKELGESFFKHCDCGKVHDTEDVLKEIGTIHGQRIKAIAYVAPEQVGSVGKALSANQFEVELVANDTLQMVWQVVAAKPLPKEKWIPWLERH